MKLEVKTLAAAASGSIELDENVFGKPARVDILHRVVTWQLEKRRGTARGAAERSDVKRTGKKLGNQKGGGSARHGNRAAPQFIGGGKAHGPRVRDFNPGLNKKIRSLGLATALSVKVAEGKLVIVEDLALGDAKTKVLIERLNGLGITSGLFVDGAAVDASFALACANLHKIDVMPAVGANVYDILNHDTLVLTRAAVAQLEARING
ncbi:50S ribosomal protein L4 [Polymorphobacter arshaanensis]|jgi:large subunit ribosomal protein L4|uniref:Large ribosomal subunit protein uL4 n=1 Tax=Glacieibacterium arshaanense TaxID=2511025 RepID=A0A4Y9EKZ9_9SPHN|nr:50S ribosomal protein L4 [Polymorphobacter arshaanensis]TFU01040.1 50S ribosomal protein L4 [Polymorphobacter arshaanensis]